jgi:exosortase E/protease (VPEID-CTERM system)
MKPSTACRVVFVRWAGLLGILVVELLGLTVRFDARSLTAGDGLLVDCVAQARFLPEISLAIAAALLIAGRARLRTITLRLAVRAAVQRRWRQFAIAHLAAFVLLGLASTYVFDEIQAPRLWLAIWPVLAAATLGLWLGAVAPYQAWLSLVRREAPVLAAGAGVGFVAWSAGCLTQKLWEPLGDATFRAVAIVLRQFYPHVLVQPAERVIGVPSFSVEIAPHCSGYEGIGLTAVFLATFLWLFRRQLRFPHALLLVPAGLTGIWVGNVLRITALIGVGASWSPEVALGGFHSQAGWIIFNLLSVGLVAAALRMPFFLRAETVTGSNGKNAPDAAICDSDSAAYLIPFLAITATSMVCGAMQTDFDMAYPLKVFVAGLAAWHFRGAYRRLNWTWSWPAVLAGTGVFGLWIALDLLTGTAHKSTLGDDLSHLAPGWAAAWIVLRIIGSVVTVPLAEELAFRGYLLRRWASPGFEDVSFTRCSWPSIVISSVLFGLLHGRWFAGGLAGLAYAVVLRRRGNFGDAVLAHAVTNAQIAATVLLAGAWNLWG